MDKKLLGAYGERISEIYLKNQNFSVIERNYRTKAGEIDIIAKRDEILHFIEVKTRSDKEICLPRKSVGNLKQRKIRETAKEYLRKKDIDYDEIYFDVLEVQLNFLESCFN